MNLIPSQSEHDVRVHILPDYWAIGGIGVVILLLMIVNKKLL